MLTTNIHAPAGGHVSPVNGQWYDGGQFMPDHGLFCGLSPRKQLAAINHALDARRQERHEKVVPEGDQWRYKWRAWACDPWQNGCIRATLAEMVAVLNLTL